MTSLHRQATSPFKQGRAPWETAGDTDTTPEGEAGQSQTCMKKQVRRIQCVPVRCRVGLWAPTFKIMSLCTLKMLYLKHTRFNQDGGQNHPGLHATRHTAAEGKVSKTKLRSQYAKKKKSQNFRVICVKSKSSLKLWMPSQSQVESFISVSQVSLKSSNLWLESNLSHVMWLESPTSGGSLLIGV